jgi:hypothetical protein
MSTVEKNCTVSVNEPRTISSTRKTRIDARTTVTSTEPAARRKARRRVARALSRAADDSGIG